MKIQERITFTFEEIFTLIAKDPQITQLNKFVFRGVHDERSENPFALIGKMEVSWDDIHQTINAELEKIGKSYTDFTVQIDYNNFLCCGKETSSAGEEKANRSSVDIDTTIETLLSEEGAFGKLSFSTRLKNVLLKYSSRYRYSSLKDFLSDKSKPRNFGKESMVELTAVLFEKGIDIKDFPAKKWFPDVF